MKKAICFSLILILLFLSSCESKNLVSGDAENSKEQAIGFYERDVKTANDSFANSKNYLFFSNFQGYLYRYDKEKNTIAFVANAKINTSIDNLLICTDSESKAFKMVIGNDGEIISKTYFNSTELFDPIAINDKIFWRTYSNDSHKLVQTDLNGDNEKLIVSGDKNMAVYGNEIYYTNSDYTEIFKTSLNGEKALSIYKTDKYADFSYETGNIISFYTRSELSLDYLDMKSLKTYYKLIDETEINKIVKDYLIQNGITKEYAPIMRDDYGDVYYTNSDAVYFRFSGSPDLPPVLFKFDLGTLTVTPVLYGKALTDDYYFICIDDNTMLFSDWDGTEIIKADMG